MTTLGTRRRRRHQRRSLLLALAAGLGLAFGRQDEAPRAVAGSVERCELLVRVVGRDGRPWPEPVGLGGWSDLVWPRSGSPRGEPGVVLAPVDPDPWAAVNPYPWDSTHFARGTETDEGLVFEVEPGRRYVMGYRRPGEGWRPVPVQVPFGSSRVVRELVHEELAMGTLTVVPLDLAGEPVERAEVRVEDPDTGVPLVRFGPGLDGSARTFRLPGGSYRVVVEGSAWINEYHARLLEPRAHGAFVTRVALAPDTEQRVEAPLPAGARLRVRVVGEPSEEDLDSVRRTDVPTSLHERCSKRARINLAGGPHWPRPVWFQGRAHFAGSLVTFLELGTDGVSEVLPAGRFTLIARLPSGRVASAPVELVDGQTTDVELVFE